MATPADQAAYKDVIPLDFGSVKTLPDSFVWPESDDFYSGTDQPCIPVINLMDPNASQLIIQACETWGVFQLIGHGIPQKLVEDMESQTHRLFALPADQKLKTLRTPGKAIIGYGNPPFQARLSRKLWQEGFTIMGYPVDQARVLWPHDYQGVCDTMDEYQKQVKALAEQLIRIVFKFLSISQEEVDWFDDPTNMCPSAFQLNSYPPCPDPTQALGLPPHTDGSLFTILHSRTEGLQVFKEGVGWITVQPNPEAFIVNLGDVLHIMSNGRFVSVLHRAAVIQKDHRISAAYFYWPPMDFTISPILSKNSADSEQVPKYRSVTLKEYHVIKTKHCQDTLSVIRI
ncbi:PREDICTED: gibberellin 3-beta-dioxygenase 1-like [Fragaria vesca subsp. vesca]|uniref:gibberellin 3-beta-dioxygenase 1-like n=1 Tax=Fragaria vesca subsp. vesca TaxID=101020 RepID=UPI0002C35A74|nr:PREDICTED: gibberellin 3-beta-dioxygenase 1-like [Fragaria vesca subsp. vesca]